MRHWTPVVVFVVLLGFLMFGLTRDPNELPSPFIDKPAPDFSLPSLLEPDVTMDRSVLTKGWSLVNVWATWCVGCRQEHDFLLQLSTSGAIPVFGINWRDNGEEAIRWLQQLGDPYVMSGFDADGRVGIDWGVYGAPETFLVDGEGIVRHKHLGPLSAEIWQRDFVPLISGGSK
ncbi:MAG: DsbE family thiol:disulfide interchange protein [Woeseiaceae bacterium]|nr:DsbE family thiol:disulfide interchange protein [Woeseiaceae bacterium]